MSDLEPVIRSAHLADESETLAFGAALLPLLGESALVFLCGQLGAGKTTLVRGILRALGHTGSVKSPTYTLLEPYEVAGRKVYHFDLYRIGDPGELEYIGLDELMEDAALVLVEWPERARERLPRPDVEIRLGLEGDGRRVEVSIGS